MTTRILFFTLAAALTAPAQPAGKGPDPAAFRLAKVQRGDLVPVLELEGVIRPERLVGLRSRLGGLVEKVHVRDGQAVKAGEVLVQLDDRAARLARDLAAVLVEKARAEMAGAEAQLKFAETALQRARRLFEMKALGADELAQAERQVEAARAKADEARTAVKLAEIGLRKTDLDLEATRVAAPFDGVVLEVGAVPGDLVSAAGERLVLLASPAALVFRAALEAPAAEGLRPGQPVKIGEVETKVERIVPVWRDGDAFPRSMLEARVPNPKGEVVPLRKATAQVPLAKLAGVLLVPRAALKWRPLPEEVPAAMREAFREFKYQPEPAGRGLVTLLVQGTLRPVEVEVLATSADQAAIKGPVNEGDAVLVGRAGLE